MSATESCGQLLLAAAALGLTALVGACERSSTPPDVLADGTPAVAAPVRLEGVEARTVSTKVTVATGAGLGERARSCVRGRWSGREARSATLVVERVDVRSSSVTLLDPSGPAVLGCDAVPGAAASGRWCGAAYGLLRDGRLLDPRLDVLCVDGEGRTIGMAWTEPAPATRYVAVEHPGYVEVYETAGGLPVRVSTTAGVVVEQARAAFSISEHDRLGRLVRRYELLAAVAG